MTKAKSYSVHNTNHQKDYNNIMQANIKKC